MSRSARTRKPTGDLTGLLWDLTIAAKVISHQVNRGGLADIFGGTGEANVTGDLVRRLDRIAQDTIYRAMDHGGHLCVMVSEESPDMIPIPAKVSQGPVRSALRPVGRLLEY